jgi:hypothetical protein
VSQDLSNGTQGGDSLIAALTVAPSSPGVAYAITTLGKVFKVDHIGTGNEPYLWSDISGNLPWLPASAIGAHPNDPSTVYLTARGFGNGHVYKSHNAGGEWVDVTSNLPDIPVNDILIDPLHPKDIYVATDLGVFLATDGGTSQSTWQKFGLSLPNSPTLKLSLGSVGADRRIVAATHGRGAWSIAPAH